MIQLRLSHTLYSLCGLTSYRTWRNLEDQFGKPGAAMIFADFRALTMFRLTGGNPAPEISKMTTLLERLHANWVDFNGFVQSMILLNALPQKWDHIASVYMLHSRITGQSRLRLRASRDVPADVNSCPWRYQAYASLFPSGFHFPSFPAIIRLRRYQSTRPVLCQRTSSPHSSHMDSAFSGTASHGVTTQMTYFTTCLFHLPHGTLVLLFLYLTRLVSLVTYLFHLTLFKCQVLVCLSQFEISS